MTNRKRLIGFFLTCALCFSLIVPETGFTSSQPDGKSIDHPVKLIGISVKPNTFSNVLTHLEDEQWYQFDPGKANLTNHTHLRLTLSSNAPVEISVYPSKKSAIENEPFYWYQAYADKKQSAEVDFPYAWSGPCYIKVTGFNDGEQPNSASKAINYQLHYESVNLPPATESGEPCPVELSTSQKKSGTQIMKHLRRTRDGLLSKTSKGKKLTSLYYHASPFLIAKMAFNTKAKDDVYKNLVQLQSMFQDIAENGSDAGYMIQGKDQQAIINLYTFTMNTLPQDMKNSIGQLVPEKKLSKLAGKSIKQALKDFELSSTAAASEKLIIKVKNGKSGKWVSQKIAAHGYKTKHVSALGTKNVSLPGVFVASIDKNAANTLIKKLDNLPEVEYVEPVRTYRALSKDVQYPYQWSLHNTGKDAGKKGADVKQESLQKLLKGQKLPKTLIAITDTGVDSSLADLKGKVRTDLGKNFVANNNDASDDEGHGTHVSAIIAANAGNGYSMAGVNQSAEILPVKVLDAYGEGETEQIALGIIYAVNKGAKVINLSLGGPYSRTIEHAMKYAANKNVTIVAASGNDGSEEIDYPASSRYAIAVGATNKLDITSDYSNFGKELALVAPGSDIPSLLPNGNVTYMSGTSMAAPHVTAVAGMLLAKDRKLKPAQIKHLLTNTADDIAMEEQDNKYLECYNDDYEIVPCSQQPGYDYASGWGRLNAFSAVSALDLRMNVSKLKDNMISLTGSAKKGTRITIKKGKQVLGKATADSNGKFKVSIKKVQRADTVLHLSGENGSAKTTMKIIVKKGTKPPAPKVKAVSNKSTIVTGTTLANLGVKIKNHSNKSIASGKANNKGTFKLKIKKQKAGTVLHITVTDLAKRQSKAAKIVVADKIPPKAPKVNKITTRDTLIRGKTETGATVVVKQKGKKIASKKTDSKGNFNIKIKKQKAGTILYVTSKDKAGNISKATKVAVEK